MTRSILILTAFSVLSLGACKKQPPEIAPKSMDVATATPAPVPATVVAQIVDNFSRVHFAFDSARLDEGSRQALDKNVVLLQAHPKVRVEVQGHADERGTTDYNLALGDRRANAVRDYMMKAGVSGRRLTTVSLGEERPLDSGASETAWSQNRRAEFRVLVSDAAVQGTTTQ